VPVRIRAKAPLRLSFAGGGTDVSPFLEREGGCVLSATISRYSWGTLSPREDGQIYLESADLGALFYFDTRSNLVYDGKMDLAKAAIRNLNGQDSEGFDLFLQTDAPPGSGLGSSSSLMVNMIGLLREFKALPLTEYDMADLAFQIERKQLGIRGGLQDQYASVFGGFNFIEFHADHVIVNPLRINRDSTNELEHNLLLCYTGKPRTTDGIIQDQVGRYEHNDEAALERYRKPRHAQQTGRTLRLAAPGLAGSRKKTSRGRRSAHSSRSPRLQLRAIRRRSQRRVSRSCSLELERLNAVNLREKIAGVNGKLAVLLGETRQALRGERDFGPEQIHALREPLTEMDPIMSCSKELRVLQPELEGELDLYKSQIGELQDTLEKVRVMLLARQAQMLANRSQLHAMNSWANTLGQTR